MKRSRANSVIITNHEARMLKLNLQNQMPNVEENSICSSADNSG